MKHIYIGLVLQELHAHFTHLNKHYIPEDPARVTPSPRRSYKRCSSSARCERERAIVDINTHTCSPG